MRISASKETRREVQQESLTVRRRKERTRSSPESFVARAEVGSKKIQRPGERFGKVEEAEVQRGGSTSMDEWVREGGEGGGGGRG